MSTELAATKSDIDAVLAAVAALSTSNKAEFNKMDEQFEKIDRRLETIDVRFGQIDEHFEKIDEQFNRIDEQFGKIDERFKNVEREFVKIDGEFSNLKDQIAANSRAIESGFEVVSDLAQLIDERFTGVENQLDGQTIWLHGIAHRIGYKLTAA